MKFPIHPAVYDRLKELNMLPDNVIRDQFIREDKMKTYLRDDPGTYTKEQMDEYRKFYGESPLVVELMTNKDLIVKNLVQEQISINKKKELQMDEEAKRPQYHVLISEFTDNLGVAVRNLENLADEVEGHGKDREEVKKTTDEGGKDASLSTFLNNYPKRLEALNERVTLATNRLRELLY